MLHVWELYEDNYPCWIVPLSKLFLAFSEKSFPKTMVWISKKAKTVIKTKIGKEIRLILFCFIIMPPKQLLY
jgi:hypothetical protein